MPEQENPEQSPLLQVENLRTTFFTRRGPARAVDDISYSIEKGKVLGIVGESGCGKSVTAFSLMGLLDHPGKITGGNFVFVSGQASVDSNTGDIVPDTFEGEMRRSMENIKNVLEASGCALKDVVNVKSYVNDQNDLPQYNEIYREYFPEPQPSRSTIIGVLGTALKFEIDCIAYKGN